LSQEPKHTPGPWIARGYGDECEVIKAPQCLADRYAPIEICKCGQDVGENERCPDARLIAAAPDLLEVAEMFLEYTTAGKGFNYPLGSVEMLFNAIAKAKGEAT